jgi:hypothetical protein
MLTQPPLAALFTDPGTRRYFRCRGGWAVFDGVMVRDDIRVKVDLIIPRSELLSSDN